MVVKGSLSGLIMIAASLAVITIIVTFLYQSESKKQEEEVHAYATSLIRILSNIPINQLALPGYRTGPLDILREGSLGEHFAYAVVFDHSGKILKQTAAADTQIPQDPFSESPSEWLGAHQHTTPDGRVFTEYHAPLLEQGEFYGYLRLGVYEPSIGLSHEQLTFVASLSLPIFLLTPLFYYFLRRETMPLNQINNAIDELLQRDTINHIEVAASGELNDFMAHLNHLLDSAKNRIGALESQQREIETATRLLTYRRERVETVLQSMPDGIIVLDESGVISYINDKLPALIGKPAVDVVGMRAREWCDDKRMATFLSRYEETVGEDFSSDSMEFQPESAPDKTLMVNAYPLFSPKEDSLLLGTLIVIRDATQEALAKRHRGEFVAHIAHELKTPLNVLTMYSEALQGEEGQEASFRIEALNVIQDEVERLSSLINNLLSLTKFEMGNVCIERNRVKLRELLEDAFDTIARSGSGKDLNFTIDLPNQLSSISVDKDLLRIAINNLLTNAIKYNHPGGEVSLVAREDEEQITISVRDTGIGIDDADLGRVFDKFYRSDDEEVRQRTGHGLGLSLAREIVELHHGAINLSSEPGKGSEFTIVFDKEFGLVEQGVGT